jgi:hypothetical protein
MPKNTATRADAAIAVDEGAVARAEVARLNASELGIAILYRAKAAELAGVRADRGDQVLAADDPAGAAREAGQRVSAMREELQALADAAQRARERRLAAIPGVYQAEADEAERKAAQLDVDAANLEAESGRLRKALEQHDDWAYVASMPTLPEGGIGGQAGGGTLTIVDARGPRHARLHGEAQSLRTQAAQGRFRQPHRAGMVEADVAEDLFAAVHADAMRIGPRVDAIVGWSEGAVAKERARRARITSGDGFVPVDAPIRLRLEWRQGTIDPAQSGVIQPELVEVLGHFDSAAELNHLDAPAEESRLGRRPSSARDPYDTSATPEEIAREAANTGQSLEEVAEALGVAVPGMRGGVEVRNV